MDINDLTLGQVRELQALNSMGQSDPDTRNPLEGKYCVFRGYRTGVYAGLFESVATLGGVAYAVVRDCRRLQYQKYKGFTLNSVAEEGLADGSKLAPAVGTHLLQLADICESFPVSADAEKDIRGRKNG